MFLGMQSKVVLIVKECLVMFDVYTDLFVASIMLGQDTGLGAAAIVCLFVSNGIPILYAI